MLCLSYSKNERRRLLHIIKRIVTLDLPDVWHHDSAVKPFISCHRLQSIYRAPVSKKIPASRRLPVNSWTDSSEEFVRSAHLCCAVSGLHCWCTARRVELANLSLKVHLFVWLLLASVPPMGGLVHLSSLSITYELLTGKQNTVADVFCVS